MSYAVVGISSNNEEKIIQNENINKESLEKTLGRKLTLKERLLLPLVKKKIKTNSNSKKNHTKKRGGGKSQIVALILCLFLGLLGIHRFYLGYTGMGVLFLLTAGIFGIGWLIDIILLIIPNGLTPKGQTRYRD
jgi:TM2 domain-containing membrane protein YozV